MDDDFVAVKGWTPSRIDAWHKPLWPKPDPVDEIEDLFGPPAPEVEWRVRTPVHRIGERDPIPDVVRAGVYERDGQRCVQCGSGRHLQLDHIEPWTSGGSDRSSNLRTYCAGCNEARSNYKTNLDQPLPPVAVGCERCTAYADNPLRGYCLRCHTWGLTDTTWTV